MNQQTQQIRLTPEQAVAHIMFDLALTYIATSAQMLALQCPNQKDAAKAFADVGLELEKRAGEVRKSWARSIQLATPADVPGLARP